MIVLPQGYAMEIFLTLEAMIDSDVKDLISDDEELTSLHSAYKDSWGSLFGRSDGSAGRDSAPDSLTSQTASRGEELSDGSVVARHPAGRHASDAGQWTGGWSWCHHCVCSWGHLNSVCVCIKKNCLDL